jgi:hypothetical protein
LAPSVTAGSVRTRGAGLRHRLRMLPGAGVGKTAEDNARDRRSRGQRVDRGRNGDPRGAIGRKTVNAGRNGRKGNRGKAMGLHECDRAGVAGRQCLIFLLAPAVPHWTDGMNHMPRRQSITFGDFGVAGLAAMERAAFGQQFGAGRAMDRAIDAATAEQRGIRSVDDGVNAQGRDVGDDDFQPRRTYLARGETQAEAAALTVTPLSAKSCCNSPAWNISRMMSQPPTNSPLT